MEKKQQLEQQIQQIDRLILAICPNFFDNQMKKVVIAKGLTKVFYDAKLGLVIKKKEVVH